MKNPEKEFDEIFKELTKKQREFVAASIHSDTKREAAEKCGIHPHTTYAWDGKVDEAIRLLQKQRVYAIQTSLNEMARHALSHLPELLEQSEDKRTKLRSIQYVLDQTIGTPRKKKEDHQDGPQSIDVNIVNSERSPDNGI